VIVRSIEALASVLLRRTASTYLVRRSVAGTDRSLAPFEKCRERTRPDKSIVLRLDPVGQSIKIEAAIQLNPIIV
jgi:hypothetical protein